MDGYITTGTAEYLKKLMKNYEKEKIVVMENANGGLLFHETTGPSLFQQPRKYEVIERLGDLPKEGYTVLNYIPVTDEGRPLFEHQLSIQDWLFKNEAGLLALRVLRPLSSKTYIIMTFWEKGTFYDQWQKANPPLAEKLNKGLGYSPQPQIFDGFPYTQKYTISG